MQAITFNQNGGIETLTWKELAIPVPGPEEVLIKIKALSINPVDAHIRENAQLMEMVTKRAVGEEVIPGWDISGEVVAIGEQVTTFKKGDNVFGMINLPGHGQAYAEYVTAPVAHLALKPNNVGHESAAAATLSK